MAKQKKKKIHRLNISEITDQDSAEPESQTSSQQEDSIQEETTTLTSKRKPNTISPLENQPKSKMANCTTTPKAT